MFRMLVVFAASAVVSFGSAQSRDSAGHGAGLPDDWQMKGSTGIGLANTAARLQQLYDDDHQFDIRNRDTGGVEVVILIPMRTA